MSPGRAELRDRLLEHAVDLTREQGPDSVSLREVQRRAGVSPAAAYRHYRDRQALMAAVGQRAGQALSAAISAAVAAVPTTADPRTDALARMRAGNGGYLRFARREPGLFRAIFLADDRSPDEQSAEPDGNPYGLLQAGLADLAELGVLSPSEVEWTDVAVWASIHGLALLLMDGPLRDLDETQQQAATDRLLDLLTRGLTGPGRGGGQR